MSGYVSGGGDVVLYDASGNPINSGTNNADGLVAASERGLNTRDFLYLFNGTTWDRGRNNSAANLAAATQPHGLMVASPGEWSIIGNVAFSTATLATATKAAGGAGVRHVARTAHFSVGGAASGTLEIMIRDGATAAGTIIWAGILVSSTNDSVQVTVNLNLFGTANTAMTIEFHSAGLAGSIEVCTLTGYSTL